MTKLRKYFRREGIDPSGYLFLIPAVSFFLIFVFYPMLKGIYLSFFETVGRTEVFVGFKNYQSLIHNAIFWKSIRNTALITVIAVPIVVALAIFISIHIYNKHAAVRSLFRGIFYIPAISSVVSITVVWLWIYNPDFGILNYILKNAGVIGTNVQWLGSAKTALYAIIAVLITTSLGQPIVLYVAALGNVPVELLESAEIDGANNWQKFKSIIWPMIKPTTLYVVVTTTINTFQIFSLIQLMTAGGPNYSSSTVMYLVYERAIFLQDYGLSSAMGVVLAAIIAFVSILQFKYLSDDVAF